MEDKPYPVSAKQEINSDGYQIVTVVLSDGTEIVEHVPIPPELYVLTYSQIYNLMIRAYNHGYSTYEMVESGLESYDPDSNIRWMLLDLDKLNNNS